MRFFMVCNDCGDFYLFNQKGHNGDYQCVCGGDLCGCGYCTGEGVIPLWKQILMLMWHGLRRFGRSFKRHVTFIENGARGARKEVKHETAQSSSGEEA